jgi:hypothetical protein
MNFDILAFLVMTVPCVMKSWPGLSSPDLHAKCTGIPLPTSSFHEVCLWASKCCLWNSWIRRLALNSHLNLSSKTASVNRLLLGKQLIYTLSRWVVLGLFNLKWQVMHRSWFVKPLLVCMYVCVRGGPIRPLHHELQWSIVLPPSKPLLYCLFLAQVIYYICESTCTHTS